MKETAQRLLTRLSTGFKAFSWILFMILAIVATVFCMAENINAATAKNKIEVSKVTVTSSYIDVKIKITADGKKDVFWGDYFSVERCENDKWVKLDMKDDFCVEDIAYCMVEADNGKVERAGYHTYRITNGYEMKDLRPGEYRICMSINFKGNAKYAEFIIPEYKKVELIRNSIIKVNKGAVIKLIPKTNKKISWKSNNKKIATVNRRGLVTAKKAGKVKITAKYGNKTLKCVIMVTKVSKASIEEIFVTDKDVIVKVKYMNNSNKILDYGRIYSVERYENGAWKELEWLENIAFTCEAYCMTPGAIAYDKYNLAEVYGRENLIPGKYRVKTGFNVKKKNRYVEFEITE